MSDDTKLYLNPETKVIFTSADPQADTIKLLTTKAEVDNAVANGATIDASATDAVAALDAPEQSPASDVHSDAGTDANGIAPGAAGVTLTDEQNKVADSTVLQSPADGNVVKGDGSAVSTTTAANQGEVAAAAVTNVPTADPIYAPPNGSLGNVNTTTTLEGGTTEGNSALVNKGVVLKAEDSTAESAEGVADEIRSHATYLGGEIGIYLHKQLSKLLALVHKGHVTDDDVAAVKANNADLQKSTDE